MAPGETTGAVAEPLGAADALSRADERMKRSIAAVIVERYALVGLLIAAILFFALYPTTADTFLTKPNVDNILRNIAVTGMLAMAMLVPLVAGYFDLSVSATAATANVVVAALLVRYDEAIWIALLAGVLVGPVIGIVNGFLAGVLRLNALIATLAMYTLLGGILLAYTKGEQIQEGFPISLGDWGLGHLLELPRPLWIFAIVTVVTWYVVERTPFGRRLAAIGSNETAARLVGIRLGRMIFITFLVSAVFGAAAGTLLTIQTGTGNATTGISYLFPAIAVVFLGQTAIQPGRVNVWGTVTALLLTAVVVNGLSLLGAQSWVEQVFNGAALLVSLAVSSLMARARAGRAGRLVLAELQEEQARSQQQRAPQAQRVEPGRS